MHTNTRCREKTVCVSGYFNPLHKGHVRYFKEAKKLGDCLIVIVNNDKQVKLKGSKPFMNQEERLEIVSSIRYVDKALLSIDKDKSVIQTLKLVKPDIFAQGGDRTIGNIPEKEICVQLGIKIVEMVGGGKIQSSSKLLKK
ncbi:MAG: adenylyltransferase/cytidyltransferase family protein [Candidatus Omnitrophica bacterium]|nr:adenylyltransferase/cytidyltransferase family protein [Candidatus Omnitrophota bacterium]MBU1047848.1 adenylyltransferase/cytidyltransferase family protein [Candidatus Omnitrophota bacterium]MBU1630507.1 adenylyltransferase/cytidyltransferase family protein [Candidatus Omnitrophota bacterium]MBU1767438.1 adenylyltransferase/cytidyltransferase family protein [Candidatus Omnitrophota bacterium]MBU1888471.1 adenylyltransferase/cytidyltransferase family protein [Candidatus Omnitrophota bacterium